MQAACTRLARLAALQVRRPARRFCSKPVPPKMPEEHECCGNGCDECVWTFYFDDQKEYLAKKKKWDAEMKSKREGAAVGGGDRPSDTVAGAGR